MLFWIDVAASRRLLTALDDDMDEATESMNFVMGRLGKLLKTKSESWRPGLGRSTVLVILCRMTALLAA